MKKNRQCICCSTRYSYCPDCNGSDRLKPSWHSEFCGEDCKELWQIATRFNMGLIKKQDAKEMISILDLKDKSEYVECIQRDIENIFAEEPKKRGKRAELNLIDEMSDSHEVVLTEEKE